MGLILSSYGAIIFVLFKTKTKIFKRLDRSSQETFLSFVSFSLFFRARNENEIPLSLKNNI